MIRRSVKSYIQRRLCDRSYCSCKSTTAVSSPFCKAGTVNSEKNCQRVRYSKIYLAHTDDNTSLSGYDGSISIQLITIPLKKYPTAGWLRYIEWMCPFQLATPLRQHGKSREKDISHERHSQPSSVLALIPS